MFIQLVVIAIFLNIAIITGIALELGAIMTLSIGLLIVGGLCLAQFLAFTFVYNLKQIRKDAKDANNATSESLLRTVKKYSKLSVISVMFSTVYALVMIVLGSLNIVWNRWTFEILAIILCLDVFIDSLCMMLSLHANDKYYRALCCVDCSKQEASPKLPRVATATYIKTHTQSDIANDKIDLDKIFKQRKPKLVKITSISDVATDVETNDHGPGYKLYDTPGNGPHSTSSNSLKGTSTPPTPMKIVESGKRMPSLELNSIV